MGLDAWLGGPTINERIGPRTRHGLGIAAAEALVFARRVGMNVHHLELFYYVARHGGISAAVRKIPYGIQQPAISGQMRQLEGDVGQTLFERSPFRLTPAGDKLFAHVRPFFENLAQLAADLRASTELELKIAGSELVLRDHVPILIQRLRTRYPRVRLSLHTGFQAQVEDWVRQGKVDLAITPIDVRTPAKLHSARLVRVPIVLLVHKQSGVKHVDDLWAQKKLMDPLVGQPAVTSIMRGFQRGLKRRGVTWAQTIEATSVEMVTRYVAHRQGHGVNVGIPEVITHPDVRVLRLDGFEPMTMGVLWRGKITPLVRAFIEETQTYSRAAWPEWAVTEPVLP